MTFDQILTHYRKFSFSERDKGLRFERLMQEYRNMSGFTTKKDHNFVVEQGLS